MTKTILFAVWCCVVAGTLTVSAAAQAPATPTPPGGQNAPPPDADATPPGQERAIVGGKRIQPHSVPGQSGQSPEAQIRLLQREAKSPTSEEPIVVPRDIYGNPLGGNPGLNPPGLEPPPSPPPPPKQKS